MTSRIQKALEKYKPLTDEELSSDEGVSEEILFEQCRRANRLAEMVERFCNGRLDDTPLSLAEERMQQALRLRVKT